MSANYNQHSMEAKAENDIAKTRSERAEMEKAYEHWLAWFRESTDENPTMFQLFQAGWVNKPVPPKGQGEAG
ncbi:MAG: hypothetical protein ABIW76_17230 [Fibrobacteria bacterium]